MLDSSPLHDSITGTIVGENITSLMQDVFKLFPRTENIAFICGSSLSDQDSEILFRKEIASYKEKIQLIDLTQLSLEEILQRVATLPPNTVVLYGSMFKDGAGNLYVPREVIAPISKASNSPVFGLLDTYLGCGIVGGHLISFEELGKESARMLLRVLAGETPGSIAWTGMESYIEAFDWRELQRWGIRRSILPERSEIRYYLPTFWESYSSWLLLTAVVIGTQFVLILGLYKNISIRRRVEEHLRESEEQVRLAVNASGAGLWNLNIHTREFWVTDRTRELFGIGYEERLSLDRFLDVIHPEDRPSILQALQRSQEFGENLSIEYRLRLPDDSIRWVATRGRVFFDQAKSQPQFLKGATLDITLSKQAEIDLRQHEQELTALTGRLISNQEEELQRLSRELHDDLTQRLAAIVMDLGLLGKTLQQQDAATMLRDIKNRLSEASIEVHQLSRRLHPAILTDLGLVQAIKDECDAFRKRTCIDLTCSLDAPATPLPFPVELCLYRVLQECLQNLTKHSQANKAHVSLEAEPKSITLSIQDFGVGFNQNQARGCGIGFSCMKERVRLVKGHCTIASTQGQGTRINVTIPLIGDRDVKTADIASR